MSGDYEHLTPDMRALVEVLADIRDELRFIADEMRSRSEAVKE